MYRSLEDQNPMGESDEIKLLKKAKRVILNDKKG